MGLIPIFLTGFTNLTWSLILHPDFSKSHGVSWGKYRFAADSTWARLHQAGWSLNFGETVTSSMQRFLHQRKESSGGRWRCREPGVRLQENRSFAGFFQGEPVFEGEFVNLGPEPEKKDRLWIVEARQIGFRIACVQMR